MRPMRIPSRSKDSSTLPGIARHMSFPSLQVFVGNDRLTQGNAAIIGRNLGVQVHLEPNFSQRARYLLREITVLKCAAAQAYLVQSRDRAKARANINNRCRQGIVEARRD